MGRLFIQCCTNPSQIIFKCSKCKAEIVSDKGLIWEGFMGQGRPAFLFRLDSVVNVEECGEPRKQELSTGEYALIDVRCRICFASLGWRYLSASNEEQKYKEGATLIDQSALLKISSL